MENGSRTSFEEHTPPRLEVSHRPPRRLLQLVQCAIIERQRLIVDHAHRQQRLLLRTRRHGRGPSRVACSLASSTEYDVAERPDGDEVLARKLGARTEDTLSLDSASSLGHS
eukprot:1074352-Prymnesium_polylepis.2